MTAPRVVLVLPDQAGAPDDVISPFQSAVAFTDDEESNSLTYSFSGFPAGTGLSGNTSTGVISGTPNGNDVAAEYTVTVTATDEQGNSNSIGVTFIPSAEPAAAAAFFVAPDGSDTANGTSSGTPWRTPNRATAVTALGGGPTIVEFEPGEYVLNGGFTIANSGTAGNEIIWRLASDGDVVFTAGPGQTINWMMTFVASLQYFNMERTATRRFVVDGKVLFGTGAGEIQKGDDPTPVARVRRAALFEGGTNCDIGFHIMRTSDWDACYLFHDAGIMRLRLSTDQHGTPYLVESDGDVVDKGDIIRRSGDGGRVVIDGGDLGLRIDRGGHGAGACVRGMMSIRLVAMNGIWGGFVDTFSTAEPDGNRAMAFTVDSARYCYFYDSVIDGSGKASDQNQQEGMKFEALDNVIMNTLHRRPHWNHLETAVAGWTGNGGGLRIGHAVFQTCPGPVWEIRDYGSANRDPLGSIEMVNCILIEPATSDNVVISAIFDSGTWSQQFRRMEGITFQCASRDFDDLQVRMSGAGGPGFISLTTALASHSGVFSSFDLVTDANLDNLPADDEDTDPSDLITVLALDVADTDSLENGVNLTTVAAGDAGSGTTLTVNDVRWIVDPAEGVAEAGAWQQFQINVNGTNRTYTAVNRANNTITMASGFTRSAGQGVNLRITSGTTPSRGYSHQ